MQSKVFSLSVALWRHFGALVFNMKVWMDCIWQDIKVSCVDHTEYSVYVCFPQTPHGFRLYMECTFQNKAFLYRKIVFLQY